MSPRSAMRAASAVEGTDATDKCPVDHKNMSKEEIASFMTKHKRQQPDPRPVEVTQDDAADRCPVDHKNMSKEELAGFMHKHKLRAAPLAAELTAAAASDASVPNSGLAGAIPVDEERRAFDVYGQAIDPANMMPATPNQLPSPGQATRLSTERVDSSIPKSETENTWTYPSPQMFFNALKRKGKADDVYEADMESVVAIHNNMNETTWAEVMDWERRFHCTQCPNPKLRKFEGRPHDLSPAARFRTFFRGYPMPFDRHDWVIDRCGKQDVRYIIDYYYREQANGEPIEFHVRPALDSPGAAWDSLRFGLAGALSNAATAIGGTSARAATPKPAPTLPAKKPSSAQSAVNISSGALVDNAEFDFLRSLTPAKIQELSVDIGKQCSSIGRLVAECGDDEAACEQANVALNYCMASKLCKPQAEMFMKAMESEPGSEAASYASLTSCLERFNLMVRRVMMHAAGLPPQLGPEQ
jgi:cytochrome c heme-lyase